MTKRTINVTVTESDSESVASEATPETVVEATSAQVTAASAATVSTETPAVVVEPQARAFFTAPAKRAAPVVAPTVNPRSGVGTSAAVTTTGFVKGDYKATVKVRRSGVVLSNLLRSSAE